MRQERGKRMLGEKLMTLRKRFGYSQQELADKLLVSRQTISNWECNQGAPALDKACELAKIYNVSLDDLVDNHVEFVAKNQKDKDNHVLKQLVGKTVRLSCTDMDLLWEASVDFAHSGKVKVLEVNDEWIRIEYLRTRENSLFKKESVIKLIELNAVEGFEVLEGEV